MVPFVLVCYVHLARYSPRRNKHTCFLLNLAASWDTVIICLKFVQNLPQNLAEFTSTMRTWNCKTPKHRSAHTVLVCPTADKWPLPVEIHLPFPFTNNSIKIISDSFIKVRFSCWKHNVSLNPLHLIQTTYCPLANQIHSNRRFIFKTYCTGIVLHLLMNMAIALATLVGPRRIFWHVCCFGISLSTQIFARNETATGIQRTEDILCWVCVLLGRSEGLLMVILPGPFSQSHDSLAIVIFFSKFA